jgi:hypothetical protein
MSGEAMTSNATIAKPGKLASAELAKAQAAEFIAATRAASEAGKLARAALKKAAQYFAATSRKTLKVIFEGDAYDVGDLVVAEDYIDIDQLVKTVDPLKALKEARLSQAAVRDLGGDALLKKVLRTRDKPAEFRIQKAV